MTPLQERRQRARLAYYDACGPGRPEGSAIALETAVETATCVRLDLRTIKLAQEAHDTAVASGPTGQIGAALEAALVALGFEVER